MGDMITYSRVPDATVVRMSNGGTNVLWDVLQLAARSLKLSLTEDSPLGWMLARKQTSDHFGWVGFDLDEMPWRASSFESDKAALLKVIDLADASEGWDQLDYKPDPTIIRGFLAKFHMLISEYQMLEPSLATDA